MCYPDLAPDSGLVSTVTILPHKLPSSSPLALEEAFKQQMKVEYQKKYKARAATLEKDYKQALQTQKEKHMKEIAILKKALRTREGRRRSHKMQASKSSIETRALSEAQDDGHSQALELANVAQVQLDTLPGEDLFLIQQTRAVGGKIQEEGTVDPFPRYNTLPFGLHNAFHKDAGLSVCIAEAITPITKNRMIVLQHEREWKVESPERQQVTLAFAAAQANTTGTKLTLEREDHRDFVAVRVQDIILICRYLRDLWAAFNFQTAALDALHEEYNYMCHGSLRLIYQLLAEKNTLQTEKDALQKKKNRLQADKNWVVKISLERVEALEDEQGALQAKNKTLQEEKQTLQAETDRLQAENETLRGQRHRLNVQKQEVSKVLRDEQERFLEISKQSHEIMKNSEKLQTLAQNQISALKIEVNKLKMNLNLDRKFAQDFRSKNRELEDAWGELKNAWDVCIPLYQQLGIDLLNRVSFLEGNLAHHGVDVIDDNSRALIHHAAHVIRLVPTKRQARDQSCSSYVVSSAAGGQGVPIVHNNIANSSYGKPQNKATNESKGEDISSRCESKLARQGSHCGGTPIGEPSQIHLSKIKHPTSRHSSEIVAPLNDSFLAEISHQQPSACVTGLTARKHSKFSFAETSNQQPTLNYVSVISRLPQQEPPQGASESSEEPHVESSNTLDRGDAIVAMTLAKDDEAIHDPKSRKTDEKGRVAAEKAMTGPITDGFEEPLKGRPAAREIFRVARSEAEGALSRKQRRAVVRKAAKQALK